MLANFTCSISQHPFISISNSLNGYKLHAFTLFPLTRKSNKLSFIMQMLANASNRTKKKEFERLLSNFKKGGKPYGESKIKNDKRISNPYSKNGYRYCDNRKFYSQVMSEQINKLVHIRKKGAIELRRIITVSANKRRRLLIVKIIIEEVIATEVSRISKQFGKSFLDCEDIVTITGLGRDNVRTLMKSKSFPIIQVGKRQVVSIITFVTWQMNEFLKGVDNNGKN